jgi:hypothetical protein
MQLIISLADRMMWVGGSLIFALMVFATATVIHFAISRNDPRKRIQGQPIRWWVSVMCFIGACYGAWFADNQRYYINEVVGGMSGMGLLVGLVAGNVHGAIRLMRVPRTQPESVVSGHVSPATMNVTDRENPYAPPRGR